MHLKLKDVGIKESSQVWAMPITPTRSRYILNPAVRNIVKAIHVPRRHPGAPMSETVRKELLLMQLSNPIVAQRFASRYPIAFHCLSFRRFCHAVDYCDREAAKNRQKFAKQPTRELELLINQYDKYEKYKYCIKWGRSCIPNPNSVSKPKVKGPFVYIEFGNKLTAAMVDPSIKFSAVPMQFAIDYIKSDFVNTIYNVKGPGGVIHHNVKVHITDVTLNDFSCALFFTTINVYNGTIVLGSEFLRLNGYVIDNDNQKLTAPHHSVPFISATEYASIARNHIAKEIPARCFVNRYVRTLSQFGFRVNDVQQVLENANYDLFRAYKLLKSSKPQYLY